MRFQPDERKRAEVRAATERWERAASDYRIMRGPPNPRTRMQDAMRYEELSALPITAERALEGYDAIFTTGEYLSGVAIRLGIDPTPLDLFLDRPDASEGLRMAMVVVKRIRQALDGLAETNGNAPAPSPRSHATSDEKGAATEHNREGIAVASPHNDLSQVELSRPSSKKVIREALGISSDQFNSGVGPTFRRLNRQSFQVVLDGLDRASRRRLVDARLVDDADLDPH